ncbi:hypothetical protein WDZ92_54455, partial [Nostoc sp. NIES-2111]
VGNSESEALCRDLGRGEEHALDHAGGTWREHLHRQRGTRRVGATRVCVDRVMREAVFDRLGWLFFCHLSSLSE